MRVYVRVNVRIMCVCTHVTACHNVGTAAYSTEGLFKNVLSTFGILLTVLRNIGTNAFFFLI